MNRFIIISVTLLVLALVSLALLWNLYRQVESSPAPQVFVKAAVEESRPIYEIPVNRIPPIQEIEESVKKDSERKAAAKEARAKADALKKAAVEPAVETAGEEEKKINEDSSKKTKDLVPNKKEVRFPTYEERSAKESQTGVIAY